MVGYAAQRVAALGDSRDLVLGAILDRSPPQLWGDILRVPLEQVADAANEDLVHRLLQAGANAGGATLAPRRTLVDAAVGGGSARVLSALLRKGADVDINTFASSLDDRSTPLHRAVQEGKEDVT